MQLSGMERGSFFSVCIQLRTHIWTRILSQRERPKDSRDPVETVISGVKGGGGGGAGGRVIVWTIWYLLYNDLTCKTEEHWEEKCREISHSWLERDAKFLLHVVEAYRWSGFSKVGIKSPKILFDVIRAFWEPDQADGEVFTAGSGVDFHRDSGFF